MVESLVNDYLKNIKPYKTSSHKIWEVKPTTRKNILKLDWNEATICPNPNIMKRLKSLLQEPCFLNLYPATANNELLDLLSKYTDLPQENIQYFASSDVIHEYVARILLESGKNVLIQWPAYDNFRLTAQSMGAKVCFSEIDSKSFSFNPTKFEQDIKKIKPALVYICSPNNPVGYVTPNEYIEHLLTTFPHTMFLIDEAYIEFSTKPSAAVFVTKYNNIIVTRTMSKAFALANLRFGYVLSSKQNIQYINSIRNPKNINTFTQTAIIAALQDTQYMRDYVKEVNSAKKWFINAVNKLDGITAYQSEANFVLLKFDSFGLRMQMFRWLKQHDIFIRETSQGPMVYKCLRITIGTKPQMEQVVKCMKEFYKQTPIKKSEKVALFDFCDTMVDFQTGNAFTKYVIAHSKIQFIRKLVYKIKHKWYKKIRHQDVEKKLLLECCCGIDKQQMETLALNYYVEIVRPRLIRATVEKLLYYQSHGYKIYLVSGGFDMYLKYFASEFDIDGIFSTRVQFVNNAVSGKYDGIDCMGDNKIKILKDFFDTDKIDGVAFSDSASDLPLLKFVSNGFAVGTDEKQLQWAHKNGLKTLIYGKQEYYKN